MDYKCGRVLHRQVPADGARPLGLGRPDQGHPRRMGGVEHISKPSPLLHTSLLFPHLSSAPQVPSTAAVDTVEEGLRFWTASKDERATLVFDGLAAKFNPLSHA